MKSKYMKKNLNDEMILPKKLSSEDEKTISDIERVPDSIPEVSFYKLIVKSPFNGYKRGDCIQNKKEVDLILAGSEKHMVSKLLSNKE
jgi:hypothetical protein